MGTRPRIRVGKLTEFLEQETRIKKKYAELITQIMRENNCTWTEAKKIHKFEQVEKKIAKEFRAMSVNETSNQ